ncbi:MAG TPA: LacI family DNA-binding transcriptional regulator [Mycobacteriales bacterium]|nr:LacI family DNA-binding transcriptional regulator [Mycobacteriales bacterium]
MRGSKVTIHDIAVLAGVSAGTVSRVINGREGVGETTRARIMELVAEHGFSANPAAQRLSTGRSQAIGVVFPFHASQLVTRPVYPALLGGLGDAAEESGYDILLLTIPDTRNIRRLEDAVSQQRIDGVVLPAAGPRDPMVKRLTQLGFPTVVIGHRATGLPWVDSAHDVACRDLTRMLIAAGRRRFLFLNGPPTVSACALRAKGFRAAVKESAGIRSSEHSLEFDPATVKDQVRRLLSGPARSLPDAAVCASDLIAAAFLEVAAEHGLAVPDDVAVTGFDDAAYSAYTTPALTTVRMPLRDSGLTAARMLFTGIAGKSLDRRHVVLPTELVRRESTPAFP